MRNSPAEIQSWLLEEFSTRLAAVLETTAGERPKVECEALSSAPAETGLCWRQPFSGVSGAAWLMAAEPGWRALGGLVPAASRKATRPA